MLQLRPALDAVARAAALPVGVAGWRRPRRRGAVHAREAGAAAAAATLHAASTPDAAPGHRGRRGPPRRVGGLAGGRAARAGVHGAAGAGRVHLPRRGRVRRLGGVELPGRRLLLLRHPLHHRLRRPGAREVAQERRVAGRSAAGKCSFLCFGFVGKGLRGFRGRLQLLTLPSTRLS